jgi:signal transduction histidine kinase
VRTWVEAGQVCLSVCDDGVGLGHADGDAFRPGGRGLGHIQLRAAEIGAEVAFTDGEPGTCVTLRFSRG